ncbi:hypothetical protein AB0L70_25745 [Kribbella sp. NPDC051952]|uniref:hypothetical protein n=1 Tax=Kribbella sp. NPDC051952 TaxID=3154851 RepID=UPI0034320429
MHRTFTLALAATAVVAAAVPAVSMAATNADANAKTAPNTLHWGACPADVVASVPLECSTAYRRTCRTRTT